MPSFRVVGETNSQYLTHPNVIDGLAYGRGVVLTACLYCKTDCDIWGGVVGKTNFQYLTPQCDEWDGRGKGLIQGCLPFSCTALAAVFVWSLDQYL